MIDTLLETPNLIMLLASVGAFLTIVAFGMPLMERDTFSSRLKLVARRREELLAAQRARHGPQKSRLRQQQSRGYVREVVERLQLLDLRKSQTLRDTLSSAGLRGNGPLYTYAFFRFVAPLGFAAVTALYFFLLAKTNLDLAAKLAICFGAAFIGFLLPGIVLSNLVQKRQQKLTRGFPDALDLMVICVEAGLSMEAAFHRVADEVANSSPVLAEELSLTTAELAFLPDRRSALENLAKRTGLPSIRSLTTALIQSEKYGTPVSLSLRVISQEQREERMSKAERKAGALPAQLTVPMIVFFLPVLFIVLIGPAIIKTLLTI